VEAGDDGTSDLDTCLLAHSVYFLTCLLRFWRDLGER
jgi:hypothetical protein